MWWCLLWWLVVGNGCCATGVALLNRLHGLPLPAWAIPYGHKIHGLSLLLFVSLTFVAWFWFGIQVGPGDSWATLSPQLKPVWGYCLAATVLFWIGVIRHQFRPTIPQQSNIRAQRHDIAVEVGVPLAGNGPYRWMIGLPGNEIFQVEIVERELQVPRLPAEWDGLSILHLTDIHLIGTVALPYFERVLQLAQELQPDLICFTGDLLDDMQLVSWLPSTLGRLQAPLGRFFVLGNHDQQLDMEAIRRELTALGWQDAATRSHELRRNGAVIHLAGSEYPWTPRQPSFRQVPQSAFRLLLSHTPDNLPHARREGVDLMLAGHVHGGQIHLPIIGPLYCPSLFGCYYAEGLFWEAPTLLHVGRGLAGRQPLRWGCVPEVTKLVLRCRR